MKASDNLFPKALFNTAATVATPTAGTLAIYAKSDGAMYYKGSDGVEHAMAGGSGTMPGAAYAARLCALLEPDAIEPLQKDTFSYAIGSTAKYVLASWQTAIGSSGRSEVRDPARPMPVKGITLNGTGTGSCAIVLDPSIPSYADSWTTYYARRLAIDTSDVKTVAITGASQHVPFLPGAYGAIITQVTCFDLTWIIWRIAGTYGPNLANEISDSATQRVGNTLCLPISKRVAGEFESSSTGSGTGSVSYVLLPAGWSVVPDPVASSYIFRDDFMGAALDTGVWTRGQSTAGNIEIDTNYHWCKLFGNGSWGGDALYKTASIARAEGRAMVVDIFAPRGATSTGFGCVGWSLGGSITSGYSNNNFAHAVNFAGATTINVYEDGNLRGSVGSGWSSGSIYRLRITLHSGGSATYEIQGGKEYPAIGGTSWTNITPGTSASSNSTLYPGAAAYASTSYISDVRVY